MVEVGRRANWLTHLVLIAGVAVFAFPICMAGIGSTHDVGTIGRGNLPLYPGGLAAENYHQAWVQGSGQRARATPVSRMMANSFVVALVITAGKIAVSLLSAFAVVF